MNEQNVNDNREQREYSPAPAQGDKTIEVSSTVRDDSGDDAAPPMISPARGPMDQVVPDVPTGSTPLTRHDD